MSAFLGPIHFWLYNKIGRQDALTKKVARDATATDIYKAFEDFFVNGMPCDRVNVVTSENDDEVVWEMTRDIHAGYWDGQTEAYYKMRSKVMEGMLSDTPYEIKTMDDMYYQIKRR